MDTENGVSQIEVGFEDELDGYRPERGYDETFLANRISPRQS